MSYYRDQLEGYLRSRDIEGDRMLDIGSSDMPAKDRLRKCSYKEYTTLDIDKSVNPDIVADLNYKIDLEKKYDVIFCLEVFEYIFNPVQALQNIFDLLDKEGCAYISFPFLYPIHNPIEIDYLRYTEEGIKKLLREVGFAGVSIIPRKATKGRAKLKELYDIEGMHPIKHSDNWSDIGYIVKAIK